MGFELYITILSAIIAACSCDVFSCDGFVKSAIPVEFSKLTIKLLTVEGNLKHEEEVNPQNGYFMVPVYNKGSYILRVSSPDGYFFEPNELSLKIDGVNDACSKHEDIIFTLNGFAVKGVVDGAGAGLELNLHQDGKVIDRTVTTAGGVYNFRALPGKYEVATGPGASECISRGTAIVNVATGPVNVTPNLRVAGYQLTVRASKGAAPFGNVKISLFTDNQKLELDGCSKGICDLGETNTAGIVVVPCLPTGSYRLQASYTVGTTVVSFSPATAEIQVNGKVEAKFTAVSVSAQGKVLNGKKGVDGVDVYVNGKKTTKTDRHGVYQLENLKEGDVTVTVKADKTVFSTAKAKVVFANVAIPDVIVHKFSICGSIEKDANGNHPQLIVKSKTTEKSIQVQAPSGSFCVEVVPGTYTIGPADASSSLTPRLLEVSLEEKPVTGLKFTHFKTTAEVRATCIGACPTSTVSLLLGETLIQKVEGTDVFTFENIGPGHYKARIDDQNRGCWERQEVDVVVERTKPQPAQLVQNGFTARVKMSHSAKIVWSHADKPQLTGTAESPNGGVVSLCVPLHGKYNVKVDSCYQFAKPSFEVSVPSFTVHEENAVAVRIGGRVVSNEKFEEAVIKIRSQSGDVRQIPVSPDGHFSFYEPLTSTGDVLTLVPYSPKFLFEPTSAQITVSGVCTENAVTYNAFKGVYIDGTVRPPVAAVQISAVLKADSGVILNTETDVKGNYRLGPVKKIDDYTFSATLDGYKFALTGKAGAFESVKLSHLSIRIVDEANDEPLDGVLLSVVGGDFRSNNVLDAQAIANFVGLAPGEYFVRPILQEYKFATPLTNVKVAQGQHENLFLKGKRVLYSAFGKIREMSSGGVGDVNIEAVSAKCDKHQSEAVSAIDGSFRIRGLHPDCEYKIYTKGSAGAEAPHSFPNEFTVKMTAEDVKDLEFIAIPLKQTTDVAVEIETAAVRDIQSVRVTVTRGNEQIRSSIVSQPVNLFYVSGLPRDGEEYTVRVEADRPSQAFPAKTVLFTADAPVRVVRVPLRSSKKAGELDLTLGSFLSLPFFALLVLIFMNQHKTFQIVDNLIQKSGILNVRKKKKN